MKIEERTEVTAEDIESLLIRLAEAEDIESLLIRLAEAEERFKEEDLRRKPDSAWYNRQYTL